MYRNSLHSAQKYPKKLNMSHYLKSALYVYNVIYYTIVIQKNPVLCNFFWIFHTKVICIRICTNPKSALRKTALCKELL